MRRLTLALLAALVASFPVPRGLPRPAASEHDDREDLVA